MGGNEEPVPVESKHHSDLIALSFCSPFASVLTCSSNPMMAVDIEYRYSCMAPSLRKERFAFKISPKPSKPLRPCIQLSGKNEDSGVVAPTVQEKKVKKRVSFADNQGLALTMVKVFSEFDDPLDIPFNITKLLE